MCSMYIVYSISESGKYTQITTQSVPSINYLKAMTEVTEAPYTVSRNLLNQVPPKTAYILKIGQEKYIFVASF